jgi:hypothetical protein
MRCGVRLRMGMGVWVEDKGYRIRGKEERRGECLFIVHTYI